MIVTVIGKRHVYGVGKASGKPYNFTELHYSTPRRGIDGGVGKETTVQNYVRTYEDIVVGEVYDLEFNENGRVLHMSPAVM